jgi:transcriptional regulator with XRE-family HTH domain
MDANRPLNREAIGKRIGQVRKKAGLTQNEFAKRLQTPVMITEIAEHGIRLADGTVSESINISAKQFVQLLESISSVYNVPLDWLMHDEGAALETDKSASPNDEELTLYLPVTICEKSLVDEMNEALILMRINLCTPIERIALQRSLMVSIVQKYRLYKQYAKLSGNIQYADSACNRMKDSLERALRSYC